ncbi:MAG: hypothetical protein ACLP2X_22510, partial [Syntrophobacteraceae bacterium]
MRHELLVRKGRPQGLDYGKDQLEPPIHTPGLCELSIFQAPFHGFRVPQRDMNCRFEKTWWAAPRLALPAGLTTSSHSLLESATYYSRAPK